MPSPLPSSSDESLHAPVSRAPGPAWLPFAIVAGCALALCSIHAALTYGGLAYPEAFGHAQIARNLARGAGLVTQQTLPYEYRLFDDVPHASLFHPPLPALLLAPLYRLFGPHEWLAIVPGAVAYAAVAAIAFGMARAWGGRAAGVLAGVMFLTHPASLGFAVSGLAEPLAAAGIAASVASLVAARTEGRSWVLLGVGVVLGLTSLSVGPLRSVLPIAAAWALWGGSADRVRRFLLAAVGFALVVLPDVWRVAQATGRPFAGYERYLVTANVPPFAGLNWFRSFSLLDPIAYVTGTPLALQDKIVGNVDQLGALVRVALNPVYALCLAAAGLAWSPPPLRLAALLVAIAFVAQLSLQALLRVHPAEIVAFTPCLAAVAASVLVRFVRRRPRAGGVAIAIALAIVLWVQLPAWWTQLRSPSADRAQLAFERALAVEVRGRTAAGDLVITDASEMIAWRADRRTVWLPLTVGLLDRIPLRPGERHHLLLTSQGAPDSASEWGPYLHAARSPAGFEPVQSWPRGPLAARLFRRSVHTPPESAAVSPTPPGSEPPRR
jgi:hypothetical protein